MPSAKESHTEAIPGTLEAFKVPVDGLRRYGRNPRQGDVGAIVESLERHGQYRPIVVNSRTMEVLAGNHTLEAVRQLGWSEVAVSFVDVDEDQAARIVLVDNRSNDLASYDDQALVDLLRSLPDLEGTGYDGDALDELIQDLDPTSARADTEPIDPPADPVTRPGDLIVLGDHRLLCGDSGDRATLDRMFAGVMVGCVLTDPPYGIDLDTDYARINGSATARGRVHGRTYRAIEGDSGAFAAGLLASYFAGVGEQFWFGANYYRRTLSSDDRDGSWLVWDKRNEEADTIIGSAFELVWSKTAHKQDLLRHLWTGYTARNREFERGHPAEKPIALIADVLDRWVPVGDVVADPFLGSGSTLIACENTGRACYGLEIDPAYCDVIADRWERHTGRTVERTRDARAPVEANA